MAAASIDKTNPNDVAKEAASDDSVALQRDILNVLSGKVEGTDANSFASGLIAAATLVVDAMSRCAEFGGDFNLKTVKEITDEIVVIAAVATGFNREKLEKMLRLMDA